MTRSVVAVLGALWGRTAWGVEPGDPAPVFALPDLAGESIASDGRVGPTIVTFWASWCAPCLAELPLLDALHRDLGGRGAVLAVNEDTSLRRPEQLVARLGLTMPVLRDDGSVASAYSPPAMPTTYLVGPDGRVESVHVGALTASDVAALRTRVLQLGTAQAAR